MKKLERIYENTRHSFKKLYNGAKYQLGITGKNQYASDNISENIEHLFNETSILTKGTVFEGYLDNFGDLTKATTDIIGKFAEALDDF